MDNLKYYNDSVAYDFEMFAPKKQKDNTRDNIVVMPKQSGAAKKRRKAAAKSLSSPMIVVMCAAFILAGFCGNIGLRLQINEVNSQINDMKAAIGELDSERTELEMQLQQRISFANLELEASQLGMTKPEKDNIVYIRVNDKNKARISDGSIITSEE